VRSGRWAAVINSIPFLRKEPTLSKREAMAVVPVRNECAEWSKEADDKILIHVPLRRDRLGRIIGRLFRLPHRKPYELDEVGALVWELCDGANDVERIVKEICSRYKLHRREAEASLAAFLKILADKKLIGLVRKGKTKG